MAVSTEYAATVSCSGEQNEASQGSQVVGVRQFVLTRHVLVTQHESLHDTYFPVKHADFAQIHAAVAYHAVSLPLGVDVVM